MNRRWICSDIWLNILPSFDRAQLGLKIALLSYRFDALVNKHFDGKTELTIWRQIVICKGKGPKAKLSVLTGVNFMHFPLPDCPLPNKIRFRFLRIDYIDHSVIAFLRSNKPIWDRSGTNLAFDVHSYETDVQQIWDVLDRQIWPIFATNLRHMGFADGDHLDNLRRRTSPTILTDSNQLNSIDSGLLLPDGIADDGPNATSGQALSKWLHTPTTDGQPKRLYRNEYLGPQNLEWVNNFKEAFLRATTSVSYNIQLYFHMTITMPMPTEQFELVNEVTNEKLTLKLSEESNELVYNWLLQRCTIGETAMAAVKFDLRYDNNSVANLNKILFDLWGGNHCIGPLSPPAEEEADQSNKNIFEK